MRGESEGKVIVLEVMIIIINIRASDGKKLAAAAAATCGSPQVMVLG